MPGSVQGQVAYIAVAHLCLSRLAETFLRHRNDVAANHRHIARFENVASWVSDGRYRRRRFVRILIRSFSAMTPADHRNIFLFLCQITACAILGPQVITCRAGWCRGHDVDQHVHVVLAAVGRAEPLGSMRTIPLDTGRLRSLARFAFAAVLSTKARRCGCCIRGGRRVIPSRRAWRSAGRFLQRDVGPARGNSARRIRNPLSGARSSDRLGGRPCGSPLQTKRPSPCRRQTSGSQTVPNCPLPHRPKSVPGGLRKRACPRSARRLNTPFNG